MPEYLSPGVYIEEFEIGARPIEGVGTSTLGFLGETERGPTEPRLITGWLNFQRIYGGYFEGNGNPYLPYSVEGFFANGGSRCYVARVVARVDDESAAEKASGKLVNETGVSFLTATAVGEGEWGNRIAFKVSEGTTNEESDDTLFRLTVYYLKTAIEGELPTDEELDKADIVEDFDDLSLDSSSDNFYENKVNGISNLIVLTKEDNDTGEIPDFPTEEEVAAEEKEPIVIKGILKGGTNGVKADVTDYERGGAGTLEPGGRQGLLALNDVDEVAILYAPDAFSIDGLPNALIGACEKLKDRFAILDAPKGESNVDNLKPRNDYSTMYAAYYYPWIKVYDPLTKLYKTVPPGGHVAGIYARSDIERGVHKAPANEKVKGVKDLEFNIGKGEQDILNPRGVNCIRAFSGRGIRVWGARTLSSNALWKYINVRRLFIFLEESIEKGTQWVVFEPNDEKLWARVKQTVNQFLTGVWKGGALMGSVPEEAFFIKCDRSTMTQDDIDNGRLIMIIGVAPVKPAEFVIFRIAQWQGGSAATE
ncbi:MAG: phage tail protein [Candidatus Aminicenantes bacterium]|nr:phage tail protein [Candidatus Aminicenantes bacterium]NIM81882.1 phage tail protein [Candidatus Aminicenantes bacterium]NIN21259.1 phage tail protein [Candidatus Aminicenantes bacterium]NIN45080.1 phage tail protein [Candidatus Aminicenantes bacterium]NIN87897.1 phage tail protein [Candidatus Aminicenantes bacterium]